MSNDHPSDLDRAIIALNNRIAALRESIDPRSPLQAWPDLIVHVRISDVETVIDAARDAQIAAHESSAARTITINLDTGAWEAGGPITGAEGARVAASVLPGMPAEEIARAYGAYMSDDPAPEVDVSPEDQAVMHIGRRGEALCGERNVSHLTGTARHAECRACIETFSRNAGTGADS